MKKVAISQSNYIPWKGYFDLIASVDTFVLYDDMQYTRRDWRNRNRIKTPEGLAWLSVPVEVKGKYHQRINETLVSDKAWPQSHWGKIRQNYRDTLFFSETSKWLEPLYLEQKELNLSAINRQFIVSICAFLEIETKIIDSREFNLIEGKTERLLDICKQLGATEYISGPAAKNYLEPHLFHEANINLSWMDYADYPEYPQLWGCFEHSVTILDLIFNTGPDSTRYLKFIK